jgi:hypothetical protein
MTDIITGNSNRQASKTEPNDICCIVVTDSRMRSPPFGAVGDVAVTDAPTNLENQRWRNFQLTWLFSMRSLEFSCNSLLP